MPDAGVWVLWTDEEARFTLDRLRCEQLAACQPDCSFCATIDRSNRRSITKKLEGVCIAT